MKLANAAALLALELAACEPQITPEERAAQEERNALNSLGILRENCSTAIESNLITSLPVAVPVSPAPIGWGADSMNYCQLYPGSLWSHLVSDSQSKGRADCWVGMDQVSCNSGFSEKPETFLVAGQLIADIQAARQ